MEKKARSSWAWAAGFLKIKGCERAGATLGGREAISAHHQVELQCEVQGGACLESQQTLFLAMRGQRPPLDYPIAELSRRIKQWSPDSAVKSELQCE